MWSVPIGFIDKHVDLDIKPRMITSPSHAAEAAQTMDVLPKTRPSDWTDEDICLQVEEDVGVKAVTAKMGHSFRKSRGSPMRTCAGGLVYAPALFSLYGCHSGLRHASRFEEGG